MVPVGIVEVHGLVHIVPNIPQEMFDSYAYYIATRMRSALVKEDEYELTLYYDPEVLDQSTYDIVLLHIRAKKNPSMVKSFEQRLLEWGIYGHRLLYIPYTMYVVHGVKDEANRLYEMMHELSDTRYAIKITQLIQDLLAHEWIGVPEIRLDQIFNAFLSIDEIFNLPLYRMVDILYHKWTAYKYPRIGINLGLLAYALGHNQIYREIQHKLDITDAFVLDAKVNELKKIEKAVLEPEQTDGPDA